MSFWFLFAIVADPGADADYFSVNYSCADPTRVPSRPFHCVSTMAAMPWRQAGAAGTGTPGAWRGRFGARAGPAGASCGLPRAQPATSPPKITSADRTQEKSEEKIIHGFFLSLFVIKIADANERNTPKKGNLSVCYMSATHQKESSWRLLLSK